MPMAQRKLPGKSAKRSDIPPIMQQYRCNLSPDRGINFKPITNARSGALKPLIRIHHAREYNCKVSSAIRCCIECTYRAVLQARAKLLSPDDQTACSSSTHFFEGLFSQGCGTPLQVADCW